MLHTEMAGRAWKSGRFAHTLRVRLWREHLGMVPLDSRGVRTRYADQFTEPCHRPGTDDYGRPGDMWWDYDLTDPVADDVWEDVVLATARGNTRKLEAAFDGKAWDEMGTISEARAALGLSRTSVHVKAEPGTLDFKKDVEWVRSTVRAGGGGVRGRLVLFPHQFLHAQVLEPSMLTQLLVSKRLFQ